MQIPFITEFIAYIDAYAPAFIISIVVSIVVGVILSFVQRRLLTYFEKITKRTANKIDDAMVAMMESVKPPFYWFLALYLGFSVFPFPLGAQTILNDILLSVILFYAVKALAAAVDLYLTDSNVHNKEQTARHFLGGLVKGTLWVLAILLLLSNFGINVSSLIAGLGIGGIAIAFALQNILTDLFSSFAIYFDKPFVAGDFIKVGKQLGVVERVGIKTTRLRALQGEEIVISNRELTSVRIQNFHTMSERRVEIFVGIEYDTPRSVVATLPTKIRSRMDALSGVRVDRVHFASFGESALNFDIVYYVPSGDYTAYMDRQQEINLEIMKLFEEEKVAFAFPTRTVHVVSES